MADNDEAADAGEAAPVRTRRSILKGTVAGVGAAVALGAGGPLADHLIRARSSRPAPLPSPSPIVPFHGEHQAGIETLQPRHLELVALDLEATKVTDLVDLLQEWTTASASMTAARPIPARPAVESGLAPSSLTLTFGFGPAVFERSSELEAARPAGFGPLPPFGIDRLEAGISGGDLIIQSCADSSHVAAAAASRLSAVAAGVARTRWRQSGFLLPSGGSPTVTPRNLLGFKDGTGNPRLGSPSFAPTVWVSAPDRPRWLRGGTFLCLRRIRIDLDAWNALTVPDQEVVVGRDKESGAPLSGGSEFSPLELGALRSDGQPAIPIDSHVRLASEEVNDGATMLRRGYNYDNGLDPRTGKRDQGLLFLSYVRDIGRQFVPIQRRLGADDRLNAFTTPIGSATFVVPPGASTDGWIGQPLFRQAAR